MSTVSQIEKRTQVRVVKLFRERLAMIDKLDWNRRQKARLAEQARQSQREMVNGAKGVVSPCRHSSSYSIETESGKVIP